MTEGMKRVLIIDALNMYFRAYIVDPSLSTNGQPIGCLLYTSPSPRDS